MKNEAGKILLKCHFTFLALGVMCHHKDTRIENLWRIPSYVSRMGEIPSVRGRLTVKLWLLCDSF